MKFIENKYFFQYVYQFYMIMNFVPYKSVDRNYIKYFLNHYLSKKNIFLIIHCHRI
jgi:hypothetical protein